MLLQAFFNGGSATDHFITSPDRREGVKQIADWRKPCCRHGQIDIDKAETLAQIFRLGVLGLS